VNLFVWEPQNAQCIRDGGKVGDVNWDEKYLLSHLSTLCLTAWLGYAVFGTAPNRHVVIEWYRFYNRRWVSFGLSFLGISSFMSPHQLLWFREPNTKIDYLLFQMKLLRPRTSSSSTTRTSPSKMVLPYVLDQSFSVLSMYLNCLIYFWLPLLPLTVV